MTMNEGKPDPDELLRAIQREEIQQKMGKLKIFFGMSAGVGKTYSMLEDAQQRLKEGTNVLIGTINTHGRKETEKLLEGLPILPEKWVQYKDTVFEELDLDKILELRPQLVLIDELAHTNVPGSKHPKRWQDVVEILDAGINVYTTLNVQHIESRKDIVEGITGIQVRETVPDLILERATSIELVDIPPSELLHRLKDGKVYLGDQSRLAAQNFFKEDNLTALREIALRLTAEKVEHDLHGMLGGGKSWKTRERLMVAVNHAPAAQYLIRAARRLAFELDAPWVAVYVDTGLKLNAEDQTRLNKHLQLAQELGAEVIVTHDIDIAAALQQVARQKDVTRMVVGRPTKRWSIKSLLKKSFIDRLEEENKSVDILILRQDKIFGIYQQALFPYQFSSPLHTYGLAFATVILLTILSYFITSWVGYKAVGLIYLIGILTLSFFIGQGPSLFAAVLSAFSWDFFFIPPIWALGTLDFEDIITVIIYFCIAAIMGTLNSRIREQELLLYKREGNLENLVEIMQEITKSTNYQYLRMNVTSRLEKIFNGSFDILAKDTENRLIFDSQMPILHSEKEQAVALWSFQHGKIAGWSTDTLPSSEAIYFPIKFSKATIGILAYNPKDKRPLSMDEMNLIQTVTEQLGIYLERYIFEQRVQSQDYRRQVEKLHHAIFRSLSRGFYKPLDNIVNLTNQLKKADVDPHVQRLLEEIDHSNKNLKIIIDNILAISQLESGFVHFEKQRHSVKELIDQCVSQTFSLIDEHPIKVELPEQSLFFAFDDHLMQLALTNLIINAMEYSSANKPVLIKAEALDREVKLSVVDQGSGIPKDLLPFIFEKFYRIPGGTQEGTGLGLAIVKAVVDIHQGRIEVHNRESGGTEFSLFFPIE